MRRFRSVATPVTLAAALLVVAVTATAAAGQGSRPLAGTIAPGAFGPAAPTPAPIGGLRTRPLSSASPAPGASLPRRRGRIPFVVIDAPPARGGLVMNVTDDAREWSSPHIVWMPTAERPRWVRDSSVAPVDAWRDLIVTDVVCNGAGTCMERRQHIRARWVAGCACYAFADGWNRVWRVE